MQLTGKTVALAADVSAAQGLCLAVGCEDEHPVCCCRLENGLNKLHKTQSEVDVLVENARAMALDVEQKVASANVFAEQVSCPASPGSTDMWS